MPTITIPRSDASQARWPERYLEQAVDINSNPNYFEKLDDKSTKCVLFRDKIGQHLAEEDGLQNPASYSLSNLPDGYALFFHHKQQKDGSDRTDVYMFGSKHTLKFRSPSEFFAHASWLMRPDCDLENHKQCNCKYSQNPAPFVDKVSKRKIEKPTPSKVTPQERALKKLKGDAASEEGQATRMCWDDLTGNRWFREGELVWIRLPQSINNPNPSASTGCPLVVDKWPGIICRDEVVTRTAQSVKSGSGSAVRLNNAEDGGSVIQTTRYVVKFIGRVMFRKQDSSDPEDNFVRVEEGEILPWDSISIHGELAALQFHVTKTVEDYLKEHATSPAALAFAKATWRKNLIKKSRLPIETFAKEGKWDLLCLHYAYALKVAMNIANSWTQTNGYKIETDDGNGRTGSKRKTYFQGLWYGAERLWQHELIRLNKTRQSLPDDALLAPSPNSAERGVFIRIAAICMEESQNADSGPSYSCNIFGDLFDVVDSDWLAEQDKHEGKGVNAILDDSSAAGAQMARPHLPAAPEGCTFRQINPPDSEVTCDLMDLCGRLYMSLPFHPWLKAAGKTSTLEVKRLMALMEGVVGPRSMEWKESRRRIIIENHSAADDWIDQLVSASKVAPPQATEVQKSPEADMSIPRDMQPAERLSGPSSGLAHDSDVVMAAS